MFQARRHVEPSPVAVMKTIKNDVEIQGMKNAHVRDRVKLFLEQTSQQFDNCIRTCSEGSGLLIERKFVYLWYYLRMCHIYENING